MSSAPSGLAVIRGRLFAWLQYILPQHGMSRLVLKATRVRTPWFKNALIRGFLRMFDVPMQDAVQPDPLAYPSFNEFFTRSLRPQTRPVTPGAGVIVSPVDGTVSECGAIDGDQLLQAKGQHYSLADLLAGQPWARRFEGGSFATIYLAPFNYHRIHMPLRGQLQETWFVPGRLFSVNSLTARFVPRLFARNERVVTLFDMMGVDTRGVQTRSVHTPGVATQDGAFALVMVGALHVGSMATVWAGDIAPAARRVVTRLPNTVLTLDKGAELGRFNMGSTVILLFEPQRAQWRMDLRAGTQVRLGETLGALK